MKTIHLSQGQVALVDDADYDILNKSAWHAYKSKNTYYAVRRLRGNGKDTTQRMHRFLLDPKPDEQVDHKNGNGLDNQRHNLRTCSCQQNTRNRRKYRGNSKYKGVSCESKPWRAQITVNGGVILLGRFTTEIEAALAYNVAAKQHFGEFAVLNTISREPSDGDGRNQSSGNGLDNYPADGEEIVFG